MSRSHRSRLGVALAGLVVSAAALTACAGGSGEPAASGSSDGAGLGDVTLQLSWILNEEFAGEYFADSKGYYEEAGLGKVQLIPGPSTGVAELLSGTTDIAINDAVSAGTAVATEGAPIKIIGATLQKNPFTILSLADGGNITKPSDMIGKRIGVQDSNRALFSALLAANDIDPSQVDIVPVQYDPAPLTNGEVDGFTAYLTNEAITVEMAGFKTANLPLAENGLPFVAETFSVTDDTLKNRRDMLKAFLVAEIRGWTDALADPDEGARLAKDVYGADLNLDPAKTIAGLLATNALITTDETAQNGLFTISDALQKQTIASLAGAGITLEASDLFDMSLLDEVYQENPDLIAYAG
ncbi:ABC-type nitrate/sulfonate/bicarbonate transport system substrate-binding protein [Microbacterium sp. SORGH_AS428]|uniref:ABC transporter substrate-binding protein n=1 Tax=Microbacterium sp. SORGH_AS_0428 TaxID=3041788 RepID=UPI00285E4141|nr:ABC transporter substrate-binding protein [Microbacterium sp. SORGH_AS_0428]MDR6200037.1 ABC-type nitrate/sulfonate/bicarbonate transport system substrate-binding protein [Microbacterium sp. SORGH_AS_0428]